jgi:hypothetical protein
VGITVPTNPGGLSSSAIGRTNAAQTSRLRDRKQRVVLEDIHTIPSGQDGGDVVVFAVVGQARPGAPPRCSNVINNANPAARLEVNGDIAIVASVAPRASCLFIERWI